MQNPELTLIIVRSMHDTPRRVTVLSTALRTPLVSHRLRATVSRALMAVADRIAPSERPTEPLPSIGEMPVAVGTRNA